MSLRGSNVTLHLSDFHKANEVDLRLPRRTRSARTGIYRNGFKRVFDIAFALVAGIFLVPSLLVLCLIIARDGHSPIYWSDRVGRHGRIFRMMKLRTMVPNADVQLARHLESDPVAAAEWAETQKLKKDPRITRLGAIMRKCSADELPQLWNVLIGEMSVVGPRPMMPDQKSLYDGHAYYQLRPGLTGPWQVSDRNHCSFAKRADFDEYYSETLSLKTDLVLIAKTVGVVLRCTGY